MRCDDNFWTLLRNYHNYDARAFAGNTRPNLVATLFRKNSSARNILLRIVSTAKFTLLQNRHLIWSFPTRRHFAPTFTKRIIRHAQMKYARRSWDEWTPLVWLASGSSSNTKLKIRKQRDRLLFRSDCEPNASDWNICSLTLPCWFVIVYGDMAIRCYTVMRVHAIDLLYKYMQFMYVIS